MIQRPIIGGLLILAGFAVELRAAPIPSQPVHTNRPRFRIPYRYDPAEMQRLRAKEIVLYQSVDQGRNWNAVQRVAPKTGGFKFEAPKNGEYWFAVRTLDVNNRLHPGGNVVQPGLKVVVDTTRPVITVNLRSLGNGRVELDWQADDTNLDTTKLRIEYRSPGSTVWQMVGVVPKAAGRTSWDVTATGLLSVRGTITDRAGNTGSTEAQLDVMGATSPRSRPDFRQPIAQGAPDNRLSQADLPDSYPSTRTLGQNPDVSSSDQGPQFNAVKDSATNRPDLLSGRYDDPMDSTATATATATSVPRKASQQKAVRTHQFQLGYKLEDVGPSGVAAVELYITQDGGRKWWLYGKDEDRKSPFDVEVPGDGQYGFAIRVRSGAGLRDEAPQPGEQPSIAVNVDGTSPVVHLLPIQQGTGASANTLTIKWTLRDENPDDHPIHLSYAANPNGPWEPISGWIADRGQHTWKVQPGVPPRIYLRVMAKDAAGNMSQVVTPQPVVVDLSRPSARITDIEAVGSN